MHSLRSSAIESWNKPRLKINSLTFYKMNFHIQNVSKKLFFIWMGVRAHPGTRKRKALAPHSNEKKNFLESFWVWNSFCKKSRNLSWVGAGFSFQWLNFSKSAWNFALFEFWSGCTCDMKINQRTWGNWSSQITPAFPIDGRRGIPGSPCH